MARMGLALATVTAFLAIGQIVSALQVAPNSPCASVCIDSSNLDVSDPTSSTTKGKDITCNNGDYETTPKGQKFKGCMECLQTSTYSQGSETDLMWFLYNLRYAFDYCIFAYPNVTDVGLGPCSTTTACGALEPGLTVDGLDASSTTSYVYCDSEITGEFYEKCLACVAADHEQSYLANFLVALEAGCLQKPANGQVVGLNDTVFSNSEIEIVDPTAVGDNNSTTSTQHHVTPQMIIGIIIGVLALLAILASCLFIRHRKRRVRMALNNGYYPSARGRPVSSLSFRCQTQLSPVSSPATMFTSPQTATGSPYLDEKSPISPANAWGQVYKERDAHQLQQLSKPTPAHPKGSLHDPEEELTSPTPASAVSTKSTCQLLPLRPYNPAEYAVGKPQYQSSVSANSSPSLGSWSPVETRKVPTAWGDPYEMPQKKPAGKGKIADFSIHTKKSHASLHGSPIESLEFKMNFSAPPRR